MLAFGTGRVLAGASAPVASAGSAVPATGLIQVVVGLILVLAVIAVAAWLVRRLSLAAGAGSGPVRVVGGAAVGQRERVVVVEVDGTWLVLGVAPGQVRALHSMPRAESPDAPGGTKTVGLSFQSLLRRVAEGRRNVG